MPAPIIREDVPPAALRRLARAKDDPRVARRLLSIAAVLDGMSREAAARVAGMGRQTLRDRVIRVPVAAMNPLLEEVLSRLPPCTHAAMLIDNAGWHTANDLQVPPNITLVHLPPCSPELNAIERVWQYLWDHYLSGRLFAGTHAIVDACCTA